MKVLEKLTPIGKGKEVCVLLPLVAKLWHWAPYNPIYVRNMGWMLVFNILEVHAQVSKPYNKTVKTPAT